MSPEDQAAALAAMASSERATALYNTMSLEDRAAAVSAMPPYQQDSTREEMSLVLEEMELEYEQASHGCMHCPPTLD